MPRSEAMRAAHDALPHLFFGLAKYTTKKKHVAFPNLFDSYVTNYLFEAALLRPTYFPNSELSLPSFPVAPEKEYPNTIAVLLRAVKNISHPVPTHLRIYGEPVPPALLDQLVGLLYEWVEACISELSTMANFSAAPPNGTQILELIRSMQYVYAAAPDSKLLEGNILYSNLMSVLLHAVCTATPTSSSYHFSSESSYPMSSIDPVFYPWLEP